MSTTVDGDLGRRERKKIATRAALSAAALRLAVERGVENVTVEQIADEADVAVRTFFNHFSGKDEAVVAGDVGRAPSLAAAFADRPREEALADSLREATLVVVRSEAFRDRDHVEQMRAVRRAPGLLPRQLAAYAEQERALAAVVAERVGAGADQELYPALVAASTLAALRVAVAQWVAAPADAEPAHLERLVETAFAHLGAGLAAGS